MSHYWAAFDKIEDHIFRYDTRIYLEGIDNPAENDFCIGAVVGKNPGSAKASDLKRSGLQSIILDGDKLLPTVRNILRKAYKLEGKAAPERTYIQVLNLFYLCNPNLSTALKTINHFRDPRVDLAEPKFFPWIWYVWGAEDERLSTYKNRFKDIHSHTHFFFDNHTGSIKTKPPLLDDFARHTQGLKHEFVVPYLANLL